MAKTKIDQLYDEIKGISEAQSLHIARQEEFNRNTFTTIQKIERGLYGDKENKTAGIISDFKIMIEEAAKREERIKNLETFKGRVMWAGGLVFAFFQAIGIFLFEFIFRKDPGQ